MRIINRASTIFWLINGFDKTPVTHANILCNNKPWPHISKQDGHYVFINMYDGKYKFDVLCWGCSQRSYEVEIKDGVSKKFFDVIYYNTQHRGLYSTGKIIFTIKNNLKLFKDQDVYLTIDDNNPLLKVIEIKNNLIKLSGGYDASLIKQEYVCDSIDKKIFIEDFDEEKHFVLNEDFSDKLKVGDVLKPCWNLKTDEMGSIVVPFIPILMPDYEINFVLMVDNKKAYFKTYFQRGEKFVSIDV